MQISEMGEVKLIEHLTAKLKHGYDSTVHLGIGDDAAAIRVSADKYLLVAVDMLVQDRHFVLDKIKPDQLGYKSLAVNLSDIAAMGGTPTHAVISIGWPEKTELKYAEKVYHGLEEVANHFGVNIIGGDTVKSMQLVIDVTVLGEMTEKPVCRSGAKPGDYIAITGRVGASAAGLAILQNEESKNNFSPYMRNDLLKAHLCPYPRVNEAVKLVQAGIPSAMIDISDGVSSEINHICAQSKAGALVYAKSLPIDVHTRKAADFLRKEYLPWALYGGEDYELIFTFSPELKGAAQEVLAETGSALHVVGEILPPEKGINLSLEDRIVPLGEKGYDHFSS